MSPDAVPFFSRIRHNWFLFVVIVTALVLLACLAVAVTGDGPDHDASFADAWLASTEGRLPTIDVYYQAIGAVREQLAPDDVLARALESGGFTYNPLYGATPQRGYAVSLQGCGEIFDDTITADDLREYLRENVDQVKDPGRYIGGWIDGGRFYLDLSVVLQDETEARRIGRLNGQAAIFDLRTGETVYLKGTDDRWLVDAGGHWLSMYGTGTMAASAA